MQDGTHYEGILGSADPEIVKLVRARGHRIHLGKPASIAPALFTHDPDVARSVDPKTAQTGGESVYVTVNYGRWLVDCPTGDGGAQLAHPTDRRFLCNECGNADNGGRYRPVVWPKAPEKIAAILDARTDVAMRNWSPPETLIDLRAENEILVSREAGRELEVAAPERDLIRDPGSTAKAWRDYQAAEARYAAWTAEQHADPTPAMLADVALINGYQADAARSIVEAGGEL